MFTSKELGIVSPQNANAANAVAETTLPWKETQNLTCESWPGNQDSFKKSITGFADKFGSEVAQVTAANENRLDCFHRLAGMTS